ncbi:MalY/PatB family protein [Streptomyces boncukensis]|uniref:cysteine-S-conjugate beta-lyase n=1 Tax=Streptomyces boncukensis TaxID=2711219 RepID=A0A6G4WSW6_9ACTN|nr:aminotransferase class I/II-fold pyridoxal phosphate-dependent enzyme [Streptomyces boncukensis]NGO67571.1 aminotransferase class I/II-fold pyridoxal phosphate-dependent enzyme [Streptomyces boncukensis]
MDTEGVTVESLRAAGHLKWTEAGSDLLGADVAEMDYGTAPPVAAALRAAVERGSLGYLSPVHEAELAEACAAWQRERHGWPVAPRDVRLLPDVIRALHLAVAHFSRPGSPVIVPTPAYAPFLRVPELLGRRVIEVELTRSEGRYRYDLDALERAYADGGHLLLLCNPHNPLGRVFEAGELAAVCEVVARHGGRVFADEIHAPIVYGGRRHVPYATVAPQAAEHTVTAVSAAKAWNLAGLKCAQVILGNDADRDRWAGLDRLATDGVSTLGAVAATAAYRHGRDWLEDVLAYLDANRRLLAERLPGISRTPVEGTFVAWLDLRDAGLPDPDPAAYLARTAGVSLLNGARCGAAGRGFVRLNFATTREILTLLVARTAAAVGRCGGAGRAAA